MGRVGLCALADFPAAAAPCDPDRSAAINLSFRGPLSGTAVLALDPESALSWIRASGAERDPIETYLALGSRLVTELVGSLGDRLASPITWGDANLVEEPVVSVVLATHAPSDTLVLSAALIIEAAQAPLEASLYLLLEPKVMEIWLAAPADA